MTDSNIHRTAYVDPTSVIDGNSQIGAGTKIWHFCHVLEDTVIGENCVFGQNVMAGPHVRIGDGCKLQNNVAVYEGVTLEADVFCGPSCVFTNVRTPRAFYSRKDSFDETKVCVGATIGANATIVCGVTIGAYAMIGAGSVVNKDVKAYALVVGNPGRQIGWVSRIGERLGHDLVCPVSREAYTEQEGGIVPVPND